MPFVSRARAFVRNLFRRSSVERDLSRELGGFVETLTAEHMRRGLSRADAERAARLELGGVDNVTENVRDVRTGAMIDVLIRDVHYALRTLRRTPGFTAAAIAALALGIGANTAMLSVVNAVLLRPLPYADADRLVVLLHDGRSPVSPANYLDWRHDTRTFSTVAAAEFWSPNMIGVDQPEQIRGLHVSANLLPMLGVAPLRGRFFTEAEDQAGAPHVAIISYGLWQRRFGSEASVIGHEVLLDGNRTTIIGVMPKTFQFAPFWATHSELWAPAAFSARSNDRGANSLRVFARLAPGATIEQARADIGAVTAHLDQQFPGMNRNVMVVPLKEKVVGNVRTPLLVLVGAVAFVLLIACANVAHMLLARATTRQREIGIRTALGATRRRLVAQLMTESALLAIAGGLAGLVLAVWGIRALVAAAPSSIPRVTSVTIDGGVLLVTTAITFATAAVFGLVPAIRATRVDLVDAFKDGDRASSDGRDRARLRGVLVASEFALALVLLVGAGLMIRTFVALGHVDPGFDPHSVLSMTVSVTGSREGDTTHARAFYAEARARVRALPGVESASWINHLPIAGDQWVLSFWLEGQKPKPGEAPTATYRVVFPGYFRTMHIPLVRGRDISESDRADAPLAVVINEYMAKTYWPGEDPIGKRFVITGREGYTIVGVAKNDVRSDWTANPEEELFVPFEQDGTYRRASGSAHGYLTLVARASCPSGRGCDAAAAALAPTIVNTIRSIDKDLPISEVQTMDSVVDGATAESRLYLMLLASFAGVAIVLAAVGIYGVMSYTVARRTHEIGIRIALGAEPGRVVRTIIREGLVVAVVGAFAGLLAALALTRMMTGLLYGVAPRDPATFAGVAGALIGIALVASYVPARRAARIDPLAALRSD